MPVMVTVPVAVGACYLPYLRDKDQLYLIVNSAELQEKMIRQVSLFFTITIRKVQRKSISLFQFPNPVASEN